tara:strand:- start:2671 stop:3891 length:1221 start_codon:yes stop_codon:yes gene_type:complete
MDIKKIIKESIAKVLTENINEADSTNSISKKRAGAGLKQKLKGKRSDGMGKYTATIYGLDSKGKRVELKSLNDLNKYSKFEIDESVNEASLSKVYNAAKKGSYPITLVAIEKGKVVDQKLVGTPEIVPAAFNDMQKEFPKAQVNVEDRNGKILFREINLSKEGKLTEAFSRMPSNTIKNELYSAKKTLNDYCDWLEAGNDSGRGKTLDNIINLLKKCKKDIKRFKSPEEVKGTVYESVVTEARFTIQDKSLEKDFYGKSKWMKRHLAPWLRGFKSGRDDKDGVITLPQQNLDKFIDFATKDHYDKNYVLGKDIIVESIVTEATDVFKIFDAKQKLYGQAMDIETDMKTIAMDLKQTNIDMEQEAEPEGGKVADRYGKEIDKLEKTYKKKKADLKKIFAKLDKLEMY